MVDKRRELLRKDPKALNEKGDLLSILITDQLFCNDNEMIIDECMTFFFAGSQTNSSNTSNLFMQLLKHKKYANLIEEEIQK